jgi:hypothetical protein
MKIYVASSWRNLIQPGIVLALRRSGHDARITDDVTAQAIGLRELAIGLETYRRVLTTWARK